MWLRLQQINKKQQPNQTKSEEIAFSKLWLARATVCGAFFCRMQFKHTLGLQDFMNRTENQEQSWGKKTGRGKRGNEIEAWERTGDGGEKRWERGDDNLRGKIEVEIGEWGNERESKTSQPMSNRLCKMYCMDDGLWCIHTRHYKVQSMLTSPWKLFSKGATCFRKS